jgi:hypothetical protein
LQLEKLELREVQSWFYPFLTREPLWFTKGVSGLPILNASSRNGAHTRAMHDFARTWISIFYQVSLILSFENAL